MQLDLTNLVIPALVQTGIGFLFYALVQRQVEKLDKLEAKVKDLEDKRITNLEMNLVEHAAANVAEFTKGGDRRKEIYGRLEKIERESVTRQFCLEQHQLLAESMANSSQQFQSAVISLAKIEEKIAATANFVGEVNQRVLSIMQDVAELEGRQHGRR